MHWIIAGDSNDLKLESILNLNSKLKQCVDGPTRMNPPAMLDPIITDLEIYYQAADFQNPLEVDSNKDGQDSDHKMVVMTPLNTTKQKLSRKRYNLGLIQIKITI